jgi:2-C-methyl-D-erythritol 4-phosphate cytidylyltransferase
MDDEDTCTALGLVPLDGRGSMPFALLHGESLVAVASWALGEAGVELLDFTAAWADVQARGAALVVHDPLCPGTPVAFLVEAVTTASRGEAVVAGVRPVTDTVKDVDDRGLLGGTVDRADLVAVVSPVVLPAAVVAALPELPDTGDLADLVAALGQDHPVVYLEAPPAARRVSDPSDLRLLEALLPPGQLPAGQPPPGQPPPG